MTPPPSRGHLRSVERSKIVYGIAGVVVVVAVVAEIEMEGGGGGVSRRRAKRRPPSPAPTIMTGSMILLMGVVEWRV